MLGRIIMLLILLVFIFFFNAADFTELYEGVYTFFPSISSRRSLHRINAVFPTSATLMGIPFVIFDIQGTMMILCIILLEVIYIWIYISLYFYIKKKKKEKDEREDNKK